MILLTYAGLLTTLTKWNAVCKLINLFGADHHGYINRLKHLLRVPKPDKLEIQIMQLVRLLENGEEVKMSKRTGKAVTLRDLIDMIGVDAARYFMIMRSTDTHFDFDLDLARSESSDNPVYYAQYAHARICSILRQAKENGFEIDVEAPVDIIENEQALELLKSIEFLNIVPAAESRHSIRTTSTTWQRASTNFITQKSSQKMPINPRLYFNDRSSTPNIGKRAEVDRRLST